ncbi:phage/plasmid primase, P4 family [Actinomadura sp. SCN-SB]|uniref:DNA primase family protein n=1 Tax=Actinomadura sp. SCN-SB TaxID=3373092 RepID=UPI0037518560
MRTEDIDALIAEDEDETPDLPAYDTDSRRETDVAAKIGAEYLRGRFIAVGVNSWYEWDGRRFARLESDAPVYGAVREAVTDIAAKVTAEENERLARAVERAAGDEDALKNAQEKHKEAMSWIAGLFNVRKIRQALMVAAREMVYVRAEDLDTRHDLFNAGNGVVDLRTGDLLPHDPKYLFTKVSETDYDPYANHPDWTAALESIPSAYREDLRFRFGWALTGHPPSDDVTPVLYGGGANGKTVLMDGMMAAMGDFAVPVSPKMLLQSANDHPTELMPLKGARLAVLEELPEGDYLNVQTLKRIVGTGTITARYISENPVTWKPTHSLFITTNYAVKVDAVDHGSRRRFGKFDFPYTYVEEPSPERPHERRGDPGLRTRVRADKAVHEAALAWAVSGVVLVYENGGVLPPLSPEVVAATDEWWYSANQAIRFLNEMFIPDPDFAVLRSEVFTEFKQWASDKGRKAWTDQTFWSRALAHPWFADGTAERPENTIRLRSWCVSYPDGSPRTPPERGKVVTGIRFRTPEDDD